MASIKGNLLLLCFSFCVLFVDPSYCQTDTLAQGQELKHGRQLFSASGIFRLGFFQLDAANNSYLGVSYNRANEKPVWVANRNNPILGNSGILTIDRFGNFKIISRKLGDCVLLYTVQTAINASAVLLDSGNFVLHELNPDGSVKRDLWQSFDYPTDTLLPKMKLGFDRKTGLNRTLTSWRTDGFPASGSFTLGMDPSGINQMVIWWQGSTYWTSGVWQNGCFNMSHEFCYYYKYNFSYTSNEKEAYFDYSVDKEITIFPRLTVNAEGQLKGFGMDSLFTEVSCFDSSSSSLRVGCVEQKLPDCRSYHDKFVLKMGVMSRDGFRFHNDNLSITDCWERCLKNCSCVAYASANDNGTGCEIWTKDSSFTESNLSTLKEIYILESSVQMWWIWLMILVGGTAIIPLLLSSCYVLWKKCKAKSKRLQRVEENMLLHELGQVSKSQKDGKMSNELRIFSFESLVAATNIFSTENKLGEGGFGAVYKFQGKLRDGQEVAIKRLSRSSGQGLVEFKNEALLIGKLQHTNLVRLLGFCIQGEEKILIYEYMPNKSLDSLLFNSYEKSVLHWKKRYSIIEGVTQGLVYLHKYSRLKVIHRDLKTSNILLDEEMNPKISDFGMARMFALNECEENTQRVVGTYGYMPPEYAMRGIVSIKTDVFSFGVIVLEIISGKKNNSHYDSEDPLNLIGYAWKLWNEGRVFELVDPKMIEPWAASEVLRCIHVGLLCVQDRATERPTMTDVVSMLSNDTLLLPAPKQPAYFIDTVRKEVEVSAKKSDNCSMNDVTISVMDAR
ncbi:G-type lectin S-receptor-like serine/threonine-protein kinase CES101 isoform X1 [Ziziphus jujuba]|uniref:Receptor-like serine/threonine-protein kinase n=1 Tax=Ziziphus jujuba TaxID=326968 RepID=A0A6P3YXS5_ZIZJJ|nr:G-type lectin S-receptor-like serine/threonine-protein kinase CES101 isoform X1 [Ziziphus jujuba]